VGKQNATALPAKPASQVAWHLVPMHDVAPQSKAPLAGLGGLPLHSGAVVVGTAGRGWRGKPGVSWELSEIDLLPCQQLAWAICFLVSS
jgi:hypothetical protein